MDGYEIMTSSPTSSGVSKTNSANGITRTVRFVLPTCLAEVSASSTVATKSCGLITMSADVNSRVPHGTVYV